MLMGLKVSRAIGRKKCVFKSSSEFAIFGIFPLGGNLSCRARHRSRGLNIGGCKGIHHRRAPHQMTTRTLLHGIIVGPSGLLPSVPVRPGGSLIDGMPALERERCMMSLMVLCRGILPKPREQDNPWLPLASIRAPQAHMCG